jgi:hypothetical protein
MKKSERHPGTYVSQDDVATPKAFTINRVVLETIDGTDGEKKEKSVLYFSEKGSKPLILNRANDDILCEKFGEEDEDWHGKRVQLYVDKNVMFGGRRVGGVRIRPILTAKLNPTPIPEETNEDEPSF